MRFRPLILAVLAGFALAGPAQAHRASGLLQASLVEVLSSEVGVEVTLVPGMDVAPRILGLVDSNGDGVLSESELSTWAEQFLARQSVTIDGHRLPLKLAGVRASTPDPGPDGGHLELVVHFTAALGGFAAGARSIVCANHYEPIPCAYQCNGLMPRSPDVRVLSHRRGEGQKELTLSAEFPVRQESAPPKIRGAEGLPQEKGSESMAWVAGTSLAVTAGAAMMEGRRRSRR
jgi:hypothetical protein